MTKSLTDFHSLFSSTPIFSCKISYISILSRNELFSEFLVSIKEYFFKNGFSPLWSICRVHSMKRTIADRKRLGKWAFFKLSSFNSNFLWRQPRCKLGKQIRLCSKINGRPFNLRLYKFLWGAPFYACAMLILNYNFSNQVYQFE